MKFHNTPLRIVINVITIEIYQNHGTNFGLNDNTITIESWRKNKYNNLNFMLVVRLRILKKNNNKTIKRNMEMCIKSHR